MRSLSTLHEYEVQQSYYDLKNLISQLTRILQEMVVNFDARCIQSAGPTLSKDFLIDLCDELSENFVFGRDQFERIRSTFDDLLNRSSEEISIQMVTGGIRQDEEISFQNELKMWAKRIISLLEEIPVQTHLNMPKKVYIPVLRGLRKFGPNDADVYQERTIKDYFEPTTNSTPEVFSGLGFYGRLDHLKNGSYEDQQLVESYQNFISDNLFEGKAVRLTPHRVENVVNVKIGTEVERPIHLLGDGVQAAIILSFLPFIMAKEETFFFIEEPEIYLHPGLQRKLLNFFSSLENHLFFLTTHSNHFLDITIDIKKVSVFNFRKPVETSTTSHAVTPNFIVEAVNSGHESSLELLGVRNSSVFLVNATIWVEGITDRWYFRKMLNSFMEYLETKGRLDLRVEEDVHFSFVEYGGANITHWSFLNSEVHPIEVERLCAKAILIIDGDGEAKMERKKQLGKLLGSRLIVLPCREVENLLPYEVIKETVLDYEKAPKPDIDDYQYDSYKDEYIGTFIEDIMLKTSPTRKGGYAADSGTLKDKGKFCTKAMEKIKYESLPRSTQNIVKKIYEFVCAQNM